MLIAGTLEAARIALKIHQLEKDKVWVKNEALWMKAKEKKDPCVGTHKQDTLMLNETVLEATVKKRGRPRKVREDRFTQQTIRFIQH